MQVAYCEEQVECRRVLLLSHFGESGFTAAACHRTCDICVRNEGQAFTHRDMTQAAHELIRVLMPNPCVAYVAAFAPNENLIVWVSLHFHCLACLTVWFPVQL